MSLQPGQEFAGYRVVRKLGAGGMGEVYLAAHPRLPRSDALKILPQRLSADPTFRRRFIREADVAAGLDHPNVVSVYDRGEYDGQLWITMKYVDGTDASDLLRSAPNGLPSDDVAAIVNAVADALDHAHGLGLLHRDVKPANILIAEGGGSSTTAGAKRRILLADFGIARPIIDDTHLTSTNLTVGSVAYTSPEQLAGQTLDGRADQYSLACTAYQLLCGSTPFANSSAAVLIHQHLSVTPPAITVRRPDLSTQVDRVLARALDKDAARRYSSCEHFAADLAAALKARPAEATLFAAPAPPTQQSSPSFPSTPAQQGPTYPPPSQPGIPRADVASSQPSHPAIPPAYSPTPLGGGRNDGKATASLILGILSILVGWCTLGLMCIIGLVLGVVSVRESDRQPTPYRNRGVAVAGIITNSIGLVLTIALYAWVIASDA